MKSKEGVTLNGVALRQGKTAVASGTFEGITMVHCVVAGNLTITWKDGTSQVVAFAAGQVNPVDCAKVTVTTGTFHLGTE